MLRFMNSDSGFHRRYRMFRFMYIDLKDMWGILGAEVYV